MTESSRAVWPATIASASLVAQLVAGKATRDALFLTHFGLKLLPAAMIGAAALSALSVILMSRVLTRLGPARVVPATFAASAVLFLVEWAISLRSEQVTTIAVYAHTAIFSSAIGSAFWSLVNERFDPHEAKRLVGRIASGGTIGGVIGGLIVWRASSHLSVPMMLALLAAISVIGLWGSLRSAPAERRKTKSPTVATGGLRALRETPYLRDLALLVLAGAVVQALLDWLLSAKATARWGQGPELLGFFALFNMVVGLLSFAAQMGLTQIILEKRGLGGTIKLQPMSVAVGVVAALLLPTYWPVLVLRVIEGVTRGSLYRSAYELFYTPLPNAKKRATKTLIDVGVDRIGTVFGSAMLFAVAHLSAQPELQTRVVLFAVLAMTAVAWLVASRLQDGYVATLAASLKSGAVDLDDDDGGDLTTNKTLAETTALLDRDKLLARIEQFQRQKELRGDGSGVKVPTASPSSQRIPVAATTGALGLLFDPKDGVVARAAALRSSDAAAIKQALSGSLTPTLAPFVVPLLANDTVVRDVVRSLRKAAPKIVGMLVDHLLDVDVDPRVRRRIPRILKVCRTQRSASGLVLALRDPVFEVRLQVAIALSQLREEEPSITVERETVFDIALHELTAGRASWATARTGVSADDADRGAEDDPVRSADPDARLSAEPTSGDRHTPLVTADSAKDESDELRRGLGHVFTVLGLVLEREPLSIAYRALRSDDPGLRGTAFEYLEVVLPAHLRDVIIPMIGDVKPAPRSRDRGSRELVAELLRSQGGTLRPPR